MTYFPGRTALVTPQPPPGNVFIAVINQCSVLSDNQIRSAIPSLQQQVVRDFAPIWNRTATLTFYSGANVSSIPANYWWIAILDDSTTAGALGFHDLTSSGMPMAKVFAKTDILNNQSWTVTISHELLEMLVNPYVMEYAFEQTSNTAGTLYPLEVGDPVEADALGITINGVLCSNFITPFWFQGWLGTGAAKFDFGGVLTNPLQLAHGGYVQTYAATGTGFTQTTARHELSTPRVATGSRPDLRAVPVDQWRVSVPM